jgi:hypothetical protein
VPPNRIRVSPNQVSTLHPKIAFAAHAVSLDEQRNDFVPTLWKPSPNLVQEVFAGGHGDVGGGYPEHELSDVPFVWAKEKLTAQVPLLLRKRTEFTVAPNALGTGHREMDEASRQASTPRASGISSWISDCQ